MLEKGVDTTKPDLIERRKGWNSRAPEEYALPTEIWREVVERENRYFEVKKKLENGEIRNINDFITYNLDIRQFAKDAVNLYEGSDFINAFYKAITKITILDPTCGSSAFLFAALNILEPLYESCLDRMQAFVEEEERGGKRFSQFREVLETIEQHPNRRYFIYKTIILQNIYGVDIMNEAVEITKLRLFLKLMAEVDLFEHIEPLPDIDFNIRTGNTLVGFTTEQELHDALLSKLDFDDAEKLIHEKMSTVALAFKRYKEIQLVGEEKNFHAYKEAKSELYSRLEELNDELNIYLAGEYSIDPEKKKDYKTWKDTHKPFHWLAEYYEIIKENEGFDVIIGNPPYIEYSKVKNYYMIKGFFSENCGNLYVYIIERCYTISRDNSYVSLIVPISLVAAQRMSPIQDFLIGNSDCLFLSNFALRPSSLFPGVMQRLTIFISIKGSCSKLYVTDYLTWYAEERPVLFKKICFTNTKDIKLLYSIPKVRNEIALGALEKVLNKRQEVKIPPQFKGRYCIYYHNAGGYWIKTFNFRPFYRSLTNPSKKHTTISMLKLPTNEIATIYLCVLNSSLFYFFWKSLTDARHLYPSDIAMFPIKLPIQHELIHKLNNIKDRLMDSYNENTRRITYGNAEVDQYNIFPSKPIINKIDHIFSSHYGFSDEELDFITNYDIKYRMGDALFEEEKKEM